MLFSFKHVKYEPKIKKSYLEEYLKKNTRLTIEHLRSKEFKVFIFDELKNQKKSFDLFFETIFKIVEEVINRTWNKVINLKTYNNIINRVSQEMSVFNADLNQISCQLSTQYLGSINLAVVFMVWLFVIS
jgi:hypothetical protein